MDVIHLGRDIRRPDLRDRVANADKHDARGEAIRQLRRAPSRRIAAVRTAGDADLLPIDQSARDQMIDSINEVIELLTRRVRLTELRERDASTGAASVVGI